MFISHIQTQVIWRRRRTWQRYISLFIIFNTNIRTHMCATCIRSIRLVDLILDRTRAPASAPSPCICSLCICLHAADARFSQKNVL